VIMNNACDRSTGKGISGISRREFLGLFTAGATFAIVPRHALGGKGYVGLSEKTTLKPNIVLIMTDDQGFGDLRSHGNDNIDTPTMDRIAQEGIRFDRFFVSPMCGPTRASLLTGRYNLRAGVSWVSHGKEVMRLNEVTVADVLSHAGYATGCFGKWHNGEYGPYHPNRRGFETFIGFCRGAWENYFDPVLERNRKPLQTKGYITDVLTDAALDFIEQNRKRPFFCYIPYNAPHHPFHVPRSYLQKYKQRGFDDTTACVYGMVENIDDNLKRIIDRIDQLQLTDQTLLIFISDNGPYLERYNAEMRGRKAEVDEGGVRVPMFFRWPGRLKSGRTVTRIAAHIDIFPTILEMCGVPGPPAPAIDGRSLVPLLNGENTEWRDRMVFTHQNRHGETHLTPGSVRTQQYRLVNRGDGYQLYDMIADPGQQQDIADVQPDITRRLSAAYEQWYQEVTAHGVAPPPIPVGHPDADITAMQGEDATLHGGLRWSRGRGWAHDTIVNWHNTEDTAVWKMDVLQPGRYEITVMYSCTQADVGAKMHMTLGSHILEMPILRAHDPQEPPGYQRNAVYTSGPVWVKDWAALAFQPIVLPKGRIDLVLGTATGSETVEIKEVCVRQLGKR